jgi:membrane-bound lytic murein transglycosylase F
VIRRSVSATMFAIRSALLLLLFCCSCSSRDRSDGLEVRSLRDIKESGKLIVLTRNAPTTYYVDRHGAMAGFEYDMVVSFAEFIGVQPEIRVIHTISGILDAVESGRGDVGAAGLTYTSGRSAKFQIGPVYQTVRQLAIARRGGKRPKTVESLSTVNIHVVAGSSYEERLLALKAENPDLTWQADDTLDTEGLLEKVWRGEIDCTLSDDNIFRINRRFYPELVATTAVTEPEALAWFLNQRSKDLRVAIHDWFEQFSVSGELQLLEEKCYGFVEIFDYVDTRKFFQRIDSTLPKYRQMFDEASEVFGFDWTLLAAQSYQESHWRPQAQSPTGVKGIMMLTLAAAEDVGVTNRLDPELSINGGARYLRELIDRLPEEIKEPDRTWIALAAYNIGMGHMYDARTLASRLNKDPNLWIDMREVFPLLSQKKYYETVSHGYARGSEPVRYVSRIRNYEDILKRATD